MHPDPVISSLKPRLLLGQAVDRAQAPDQLAAVDADHLVLRQVRLEDLDAPCGRSLLSDTSARAARR